MKLKLSRQYLEDLNNYFMPFMLKAVESRARINEGTENELLDKICYSVLQDIFLALRRKELTMQQKFSINLKEAEGIIFMKGLLNFPIPADQFWRQNLRNQIVEQLDKQLV